MVGLRSLEVYNSFFKQTEENNKFELLTVKFDEFSFAELKDELEEVFSIPDITPFHLQNKIIGPRNIQAYKVLRSEKSSTDGYLILLLGCVRSLHQDFEKYLRIFVGLDEKKVCKTI